MARVAVVIPCFRVTRHVAEVIAAVGPEVDAIYCVDDACPDGSGDFVEAQVRDARVRVLRHATKSHQRIHRHPCRGRADAAV